MDERESLMDEMWKSWTPYNRSASDKWRSYVVGDIERDTLETEDNCVTLVMGNSGLYIE